VAAEVSIALVNDEPALLDLLKYNLGRNGYRVRGYDSCSDALNALKVLRADLIITDASNFPMNGIEFARAVKRFSDAPVIFVSAWAEDVERMLRGTEFQAADYIQLPVSMADLLARVKLVVDTSRSEQHDGAP